MQFSSWVASLERGRRGFDLSRQQASFPAISHRDKICILFDGRLYNRKELSKDLNLASCSDADLILQAYLTWSTDFIKRIKGVFALAINDADNDLFLCARDPLGYYPFFYYRNNKKWYFSTSLNTLIRQSEVPRTIHRVLLAEHLIDRWHRPEETYFLSVYRLLSGHILISRKDRVQTFRYWEPVFADEANHWSESEALEHFEKLFRVTIERFLQTGRAGIFLSGGVDSISVATMATEVARASGSPLPVALSLTYPGEDCNEEVMQKQIAAKLNLPQILLPFETTDCLKAAMNLSAEWPIPMLNLYLPSFLFLGIQGKTMGCDLILTGGGGDEWLGVSPFLAADLLAGFRWKEFYEFWKAMETSYDIPRFSLAKSLLWRFGLKPLLSRWKQKIIRPPKRFIFPDWIAPDPEIRKEMNERALLAVGQNWGRNQGSFYETAVRRSLDHTLPNIDVETNFELGRRVGIPILQPYWDADMVDLLYKLPPRLLNASGAAKGLVRCTLEKYLPSMTFGKIRKHSQFLFYNRIILNEGKQLWPREEKLSALSRLGIVDFPELSKTASRFFSGKLSSGYLIFCILNTEAWLQVHL